MHATHPPSFRIGRIDGTRFILVNPLPRQSPHSRTAWQFCPSAGGGEDSPTFAEGLSFL